MVSGNMASSQWKSSFKMGMGQNPGTPGEPQNSWDLWMFIPLELTLIGIDLYPNEGNQGIVFPIIIQNGMIGMKKSSNFPQ